MIQNTAVGLSMTIFFGYLAICLWIGIRSYQAQTDFSAAGFYLDGRRMGLVHSVGSYAATLFSAFTFLGVVGIYYTSGVAGVSSLILGEVFMILLLVPTVGYKLWKLARTRDYVTPADVMADRYDNDMTVRVLVGLASVLFMFFYVGVQIVGLSYVVETLSGGLMGYGATVWTVAAVLAIYISLGGMRSVSTTDVVQIVIVSLALLAIAVVLFGGGEFARSTQTVAAGPKANVLSGGVNFFNWASSFIAFGVGMVLWPQLWVRYYSAKSRTTVWAMGMGAAIGTLFLTFAFTFPVALWGAAHYPTTQALGMTADKVMIRFAYEVLGPVIASLILTGATAASMSTVDSQVLTLSSIIERDLYLKPFRVNMDDSQRIKLSRSITVGFILVAALAALYPPPLITKLVMDTAYPAFCGIAPSLILGLYWNRATTTAAKWSLLTGIGTALVLVMPAVITGMPAFFKNPFGLSLYPGFWALLVGSVVMVGVSLISQPSSVETLRRFGLQPANAAESAAD